MAETTKKIIVRAAGESRVGHARGNNEDNIYFNGDFITPRIIRQDFAIKTGEEADVNCFAVLDGMGRNNTGSFASLLAATRLDEVLDRVTFDSGSGPDAAVLDYVHNANIEIREQIKETGGVRTASTMALLVIENGTAHAYNAGDSRIYLFRDRQLIRLTRDHVSVKGQQSVTLTEEGVRNGGLTKYLGMPESDGELEPYRAKPFKLHKGDKFLICSDGVSDYLDEETQSRLIDGALANMTFDGQIYGLPYTNACSVLYVNKALFEAKFLELIGEYNRLDHSPCAEAGLFMYVGIKPPD